MQFFASFLCPVFPASRVQHISDLHSKFALGPHHVWKYGRHPICGRWDYRRNKKDRKKPQGKNIMSTSATQGGHKKYKCNWNCNWKITTEIALHVRPWFHVKIKLFKRIFRPEPPPSVDRPKIILFQHGTTYKIILQDFRLFRCFILTRNHVWNEIK